MLSNVAMKTRKKHQKLNTFAYGRVGGVGQAIAIMHFSIFVFVHISLFSFLKLDTNKNVGENPHYPLNIFIVRINVNETVCVKASNVAPAMQ